MSNALIDDCLICILVRLPIWELPNTELVCRRWASLARIAGTQRRCIKLTHKTNDIRHALYEGMGTSKWIDHHLIVGDLTYHYKRLKWFVQKYPNITSLEFHQATGQRIDLLPYLLKAWPNLVTLKVFVGYSSEVRANGSSQKWNALLEHISTQLKCLRHLVVCDFKIGFGSPRIRLPANFAFRLESFHCGILFEEANISMAQIVQWKRLRTFGFIYEMLEGVNTANIEPENQYSWLLVTKPTCPLTELMLNIPFDCSLSIDWSVQCKFYQNYQSLTHLHLHLLYPIHRLMLLFGLHQLANLVYLNLLCWYKRDALEIDLDIYIRETELPKQIPRYNSLRTLHLAFVPYYPLDWAVHALPALEILQMDRNMWCSGRFWRSQTVLDSLNLLTNLRQVIYLGKVYIMHPDFKIQYFDEFPNKFKL